MERHPYEPCDHPGRHGYTLSGEGEYEMCERCRRGPDAHHPDPVQAALDAGADPDLYGEDATEEVQTMPRTLTSTVTLTLSIDTTTGLPDYVTAQWVADRAAVRLAAVLPQADKVTGKVQSAFLYRGEEVAR